MVHRVIETKIAKVIHSVVVIKGVHQEERVSKAKNRTMIIVTIHLSAHLGAV